MTSACDEQRRQDALLRLLRAGPETWLPGDASSEPDMRLRPDTQRGLDAYRGHAQAVARRALVHAHPTVTAMLGEEAMGQLARLLWRHQPPLRGDLGEWGEGLAALMAGLLAPETGAATMLSAWPWLPDVARLDWARHRCERLAARPLDADGLRQLAEADPDRVRLLLQAHVILLDADWPVDALWRAHQLPVGQQAEATAAVLQAHGQRGDQAWAPQTVLLWWSDAPVDTDAAAPTGRPGVQQQALAPDQAAWLRSLQANSLGAALRQAPSGFDFSAWLHDALRHGWLLGTGATLPDAQ